MSSDDLDLTGYGEQNSSGYEPLHEPPKKEEPLSEGYEQKDIQKISDHLQEKWRNEGRTEAEPIDRSYKYSDGRPVEQNRSVTTDELRADLGKVYRAESEHAQQEQNAALAAEIDLARLELNPANAELAAQARKNRLAQRCHRTAVGQDEASLRELNMSRRNNSYLEAINKYRQQPLADGDEGVHQFVREFTVYDPQSRQMILDEIDKFYGDSDSLTKQSERFSLVQPLRSMHSRAKDAGR